MKKNINENIYEALEILEKANIVFPRKATLNVYHHCGVQNFRKMGAVFINIVNRDYCKSYVILLPNQEYPCHYHKIKQESFYVLYGELEIEVEKKKYYLQAGEMVHIERGQDHKFSSKMGAVFEEISTSYMLNDSFYVEENIQKTTYVERKTTVENNEWEEICKKWKR